MKVRLEAQVDLMDQAQNPSDPVVLRRASPPPRVAVNDKHKREPSLPQTYNVWRVAHTLALMVENRTHKAIFVELDVSHGTGKLYQVVGSVSDGYRYMVKSADQPPEESQSFVGKEFLGTVQVSNYHRIDQECQMEPAPVKQQHFHPRTMKWKRSDSNGRFYEPGEHVPELYRCREWTAKVVNTLRHKRILQ